MTKPPILTKPPICDNLTEEPTRLEGIKNRLAGLIVELQSNGNKDAHLWISLYSDRLKFNVLPAIKITRKHLLSVSN